MFFWTRKKKEPDFESKMGELNTTVLSKKDYKNTGKIEQYVVERLEQMIEFSARRFKLAGQNLEERRFSGAVCTDQTVAAALCEFDVDIFKESFFSDS